MTKWFEPLLKLPIKSSQYFALFKVKKKGHKLFDYVVVSTVHTLKVNYLARLLVQPKENDH